MGLIRFGTDGWRAIIGQEFTPENLARVVQGIAAYLIKNGQDYTRGVVIGYDTRLLSDVFASVAAQVLAANGIPVYLNEQPVPTPAIACTIKDLHLAGGIMITASHNPYYYNGIKYIPDFAGPAPNAITGAIEALIPPEVPSNTGFTAKIGAKLIRKISSAEIYRRYLCKLMEGINGNCALKVMVDPMYGAGAGYMEHILCNLGHNVLTIHSEQPFCGQLSPEPKEENLGNLAAAVRESRAI